MTNEKNTSVSEETAKEKEPINYGKIVGQIARMMQEDYGGLSTGEMAELRRISPEKPYTPALWRVLISFGLDETFYGQQAEHERKWATLLMAMAHGPDLHDYNVSLGRALAEAEWSELRFAQLMRSTGKTLDVHLRRVAQFLSAKDQKINWVEVQKLLFFQEGKMADEIRLSISRDYYRAMYKAEH